MANTRKFVILAAIMAIAAATQFEDAKDKALGMFSKKSDVGPDKEGQKQMDSADEKNGDEEDDDVLAKIRIKAIVKGVLLMLAKLFKLFDKLGGGFGGFKDKSLDFDSWGNSRVAGPDSGVFGKSSFDLKDFGSKTGPGDKFGVLGVLMDYLKGRLYKKD